MNELCELTQELVEKVLYMCLAIFLVFIIKVYLL